MKGRQSQLPEPLDQPVLGLRIDRLRVPVVEPDQRPPFGHDPVLGDGPPAGTGEDPLGGDAVSLQHLPDESALLDGSILADEDALPDESDFPDGSVLPESSTLLDEITLLDASALPHGSTLPQ